MKRKFFVPLLTLLVLVPFVSIYGAQQKILVWNNDRGECEQQYPDIGRWDDGLTIVAWQDPRRGDNDIWGQYLDKDGTKLGENFIINESKKDREQINVSISCMKDQDWFVAVWETDIDDEGDIFCQIFDNKGNLLEDLFRVNDDVGGKQSNPRVEVSRSGYFAVCWQSNRTGDWDIKAKAFSFIDYSLKQESPEYTVNKITMDNQILPDLDIYPPLKASDMVCYAWQDSSRKQWDISLRRFWITGEPVDETDTLVCDIDLQSDSKRPAITTDKLGNMFIGWEDNRTRRALFTIYFQVIDDNLNFKGKNSPVTGTVTDPQMGACVASTEGSLGTIAWYDKRNGNYDIYGQLVDLIEGATTGENYLINDTNASDQIYPAIDKDEVDEYNSTTWMDNTNPEGIWDIFFRISDKNGLPASDEIEVSKLFGVQSEYDDDEDYDNPATTWNEDPREDPVYIYESAKAVVDMMQENNIDNLWQITESETLPSGERTLLDEYAVAVIDLGWRHGGLSSAGSMTATERSNLTSYIVAGNPVLIMGNDFGYQYSGDSLYDKFHITYKGDGNAWTTGNIKELNGKDDIFTKGMNFTFRYQDTCDNYVDVIERAGSTKMIFESDGPAKVYYMRGSAWSFAWKANDGNTSHLTFSLDGLISDEHPNTNIELMRRMMAFLGQRVAPEPTTTLRADTTATEGTVNLNWTAPMNQKVVSPDAASGYILKFTHFENVSPNYGKMTSDAEFNAANTYYQEWTPRTGGDSEDINIDGLPPCDTLIFAIKGYDNHNDTLRNATLGDEPKVVVPGDTLTPHTIIVGQSGGYVKDFVVSEMMDVRTGTTGGSDTLFFTWDASNLYMGYARNNWSNPGGDMLVYFDFESGGADSTFPLNSGKRNKIPQDFHADYCFCVLDYSSRRLFQDNGAGDWNKTSISYTGSFSEDDIVNSREYTEFSIPFSDLGYNPNNVFNFLLTCQNETNNSLWNVFPIQNTIAKTTTLTHYYHFDSLGMGVSPRKEGTALEITLTSFTAVSLLDGVQLNWRIESESEIYQWIIERKSGYTFGEIGRIDGKGGSQSPVEHSFVDRDVVREHNYTYRLIALDNSGHKNYLGNLTAQFSPPYPAVPYLYSITPNPARFSSQIQFSIPKKAFVSLKIYNITGMVVETVLNEEKEAGVYSLLWQIGKHAQGLYFIEFQCGGERILRKVTLLK